METYENGPLANRVKKFPLAVLAALAAGFLTLGGYLAWQDTPASAALSSGYRHQHASSTDGGRFTDSLTLYGGDNNSPGLTMNAGPFRHQSLTEATLKALTPDAAGQEWYCSDCTSASTCVSTGTAAGQVADPDRAECT